jgi:hypothetical protein
MPKLSELQFDVYLNKLKDEVADESDKVEGMFQVYEYNGESHCTSGGRGGRL